MRFNKTKLLSYGIVLSMTAVSMLSTSPLASAAGNVRDEEYSYVKGLDENPFYTRWREKKNTSKVYCYPKKYAATYTIVSILICVTAVPVSRSQWEFTVSLPIQYVRMVVTVPVCISIPARKRLPRECGVRTAPQIVLTLSLSKRAVFN